MRPIDDILKEALGQVRGGRPKPAEELLKRALKRAPDHPGANYLLGVVCGIQGRTDQAISYLKRAAALDPNNGQAHYHLGTALLQNGRADDAAEAFQAAIAAAPQVADGYAGLGDARLTARRFAEAAEQFRAALARNPRMAAAHAGLGAALLGEGQPAAAREAFERALAIDPRCLPAHVGLGDAHAAEERTEVAIGAYVTARGLAPQNPAIRGKLGYQYSVKGDQDRAMALYREVLAQDPDNGKVLHLLGLALLRKGRPGEATGPLEQSVALLPEDDAVLNDLGLALERQGLISKAETCYARAAARNPDNPVAARNRLAVLCFHPEYDTERMFQAHRAWGVDCTARLAASGPEVFHNDPNPERLLRVGYLSPSFCRHPVADFIEPVLAHHDRSVVEATCYAAVSRPDDVTQRLKSLSGRWRDVNGLPDEALAGMIRKDGIDILVELDGHTFGSRLTVLARKPAPVQVSYLGYPLTTGLDTVDYRVTDSLADPPGAERFYVEDLVRLDPAFCSYRMPDNLPPVAPGPAGRGEAVTFGSLVNLTKVNERVVALWARVLAAVAGSRLHLFRDTLADEVVCDRLYNDFAAGGIDRSRITLTGDAGGRPYLEQYRCIDIVLDTFPFCGHTTTCEAFAMGVPVVTLAGDAAIGRMGASLLSAVGLQDLVAGKEDDFVRIAAALAADTQRLSDLRDGLRERLGGAPLGDHRGFTERLETAFRGMWRNWCRASASQ